MLSMGDEPQQAKHGTCDTGHGIREPAHSSATLATTAVSEPTGLTGVVAQALLPVLLFHHSQEWLCYRLPYATYHLPVGGLAENHHPTRKPPPHGRRAILAFVRYSCNRMKSQSFERPGLASLLPYLRLWFGRKD
jgi:hypothetical protein